MKPFIFDAAPLIYLVSLLENLKHFPESKYTKQSIYKEVVEAGKARGKPGAFTIENFIKNGIIEIKEPSNKKGANRRDRASRYNIFIT